MRFTVPGTLTINDIIKVANSNAKDIQNAPTKAVVAAEKILDVRFANLPPHQKNIIMTVMGSIAEEGTASERTAYARGIMTGMLLEARYRHGRK